MLVIIEDARRPELILADGNYTMWMIEYMILNITPTLAVHSQQMIAPKVLRVGMEHGVNAMWVARFQEMLLWRIMKHYGKN